MAYVFIPSFKVSQLLLGFAFFQFFLFMKQEHLIYITSVLTIFPVYIRFFQNTSNALIWCLLGTLLVRLVVEKRTVVSLKTVFRNPFFVPSILIILSYLVSWLIVIIKGSPGFNIHTYYLIGLLSVFLQAYIIIGYINSEERLLAFQRILLLILIMNLISGAVSITFPSLNVHLLFYSVKTTYAEGLRISGITFAWESYAEFLMMATIVLSGLFISRHGPSKLKWLWGSVLFITVIELFLTNTRGAIVTAFIGVTIVILSISHRDLLIKLLVIMSALVIFIVALISAHYTGHMELQRRFSTFSDMTETKYGLMPNARGGAWEPTIDHIIEHKLLGSGPSFFSIDRLSKC